MIKILCTAILLFSLCVEAQPYDSLKGPKGSLLHELVMGDSIVYYQCHVEEGVQQLSTASGQTLTGQKQKYTISEKYVLIKQKDGYRVNYYTSVLNVFPNKKFSGLKIRERAYWAFKLDRSFQLRPTDLRVFTSLERKGREATEYDFGITRYNTNQLIVKHRKNFKQLVIDGNYVISKLIQW